MREEVSAKPATFDPLREAAKERIKILDRSDGSKEFVLPALRNFGVKFSFSFIWLIMVGATVFFGFISASFLEGMPGWIAWFFRDHAYFGLGLLGFIDLVLTIACLDMWLRSCRVVARKGELQVATHWLFFKRMSTIPASKIIETRTDNTTTVNTTRYYDIVVLAIGEKKSWLARNFPAKRKPGSSFTENDLKVFNSGGKKISAATGIKGEQEAECLLAQLRGALGINV